jgi:hypothetical protein
MGYAYSQGIPIIGYNECGCDVGTFLSQSCRWADTMEEVIAFIKDSVERAR